MIRFLARLLASRAAWGDTRSPWIAEASGASPAPDGIEVGPGSGAAPAAGRRTPPSATRASTAEGPAANAGRPRRPALPDRPGRWQLTQPDGSVVVCRVIDRNGELYVVRGRALSVAIPIAHFEGVWIALG